MVVSKADHFGQRHFFALRRLDPANFAHRCDRPFRFDYQTDKLHDATTNLGHARLAHPIEGSVKPAVFAWHAGGHEDTVWTNCSSLTSRRASISPNRVWTMQPPRVTSDEPT